MITLYHSPFTRSHLIRFALEELGLPHELRRLDVSAGEHKAAAYLRLNPLGQLPTLVDDGMTLREAAAIALHLGDRAPERGLAPRPDAPERAGVGAAAGGAAGAAGAAGAGGGAGAGAAARELGAGTAAAVAAGALGEPQAMIGNDSSGSRARIYQRSFA